MISTGRWIEVRWRPRRVWWHRVPGRHATFKETVKGRKRTQARYFIRGRF